MQKMKLNRFTKVAAVKKRNDVCPWLGGVWNLQEKMNFYENMFHKQMITDTTVYEYIPIQIVTCLQSDFRRKIIQLLKTGEPYLSNCKKLIKIRKKRIDVNDLLQIEKEKLCVEEIIAHKLTFDNFEMTLKYFSVLFDIDFRKEFLGFSSNSYQNTILNHCRLQWPSIYKDLTSTFILRDIYCNEFDPLLYTDIPTLLRYLKSSILFMNSLNIFFDHKTKIPHKRSDPKKEFENAELKLSQVVKEIIASIDETGFDSGVMSEYLDLEISVWKNYRNKHSKKTSEHHYTPIQQKKQKYWSVMVRMTLEKIQSLEHTHSTGLEFLEIYRSVNRFT